MTDPLEEAVSLLQMPFLRLSEASRLVTLSGLMADELSAARPVVAAAEKWAADPYRLAAIDMLPSEAVLLDAVQARDRADNGRNEG